MNANDENSKNDIDRVIDGDASSEDVSELIKRALNALKDDRKASNASPKKSPLAPPVIVEERNASARAGISPAFAPPQIDAPDEFRFEPKAEARFDSPRSRDASFDFLSGTDRAKSFGDLASSEKISFDTSKEENLEFDSLEAAPEGDDSDFLERLEYQLDYVERDETYEKYDPFRKRATLEEATRDAPMWLTSLCVHLILVIILALIVINPRLRNRLEIVSEPGFGDAITLDEVFDPDASLESLEDVEFEAVENVEIQTDVQDEIAEITALDESETNPMPAMSDLIGTEAASLDALTNGIGAFDGDDLSARGKNKAALLLAGGGNEGSERSVALALAWFAEHQLPDGSWSLQLARCPKCQGQCSHSGRYDSPIAATSMALLAFLAAGNTPTKGLYKNEVARGLNFLTSCGRPSTEGTSFREEGGTMYSHGLATITLCEAYAMLTEREKKKYRALGELAQSAVVFIEYAQADDGGWRYSPRQAGDTSVVGWMMMALKAAQLANLDVRGETVLNARNFLRDVVSFEYETRYGYTSATPNTPATDCIGLLCRLYLDWTIENPSLLKGVERVANVEGPKFGSPYYMYYATQLLYNVGGDSWKQWNARVRDELIRTQSTEGHERGSWYPDNGDGHVATGGRLMATALNCMILEVYYRHMPIYQKVERNQEFPE